MYQCLRRVLATIKVSLKSSSLEVRRLRGAFVAVVEGMMLTLIGALVLLVCVGLKIYIIHNNPGHLNFRDSPLFTTESTRQRMRS